MDITSYLLGKKSSSGGGSGGLDWSAIGYEQRPQSIDEDYEYAKQIYDNWDAEQTDLYSKFKNDLKLKYMPLVDTSNVNDFYETFSGCQYLIELPLLDLTKCTNMSGTFKNCALLKKIPNFNTSKVGTMSEMCYSCRDLVDVPVLNTSSLNGNNAFRNTFAYCTSLTDTSIDNILQMCINATLYSGSKTLSRLGFMSTDYPATRIQALPHYNDFVSAGWTIGY